MENNRFAQNIYFKGFNERKINYLKGNENVTAFEKSDSNLNIPASVIPMKSVNEENSLGKLNVHNINSNQCVPYQSLKNISYENNYINNNSKALNFKGIQENAPYLNSNMLFLNSNINSSMSSNLPNSTCNFSQTALASDVISDNRFGKNAYGDVKHLDRIGLNNLHINSFSNSRNVNMKNNEYGIPNAQQKLNYLSNKENTKISHDKVGHHKMSVNKMCGNKMNIHSNNTNTKEGCLNQYNMNLNGGNILPLSKNMNTYESGNVQNGKEIIYNSNNIYQTNRTTSNVNNVTLSNMKNNLTNFMNSEMMIGKGIARKNYNNDRVVNTLDSNAGGIHSNSNANLKPFDNSMGKLKDIEMRNGTVSNQLSQNISLNTFANTMNSHLISKNQCFSQLNNINNGMNKLMPYNMPPVHNPNSVKSGTTTMGTTMGTTADTTVDTAMGTAMGTAVGTAMGTSMGITNVNITSGSNLTTFNKNILLSASTANNNMGKDTIVNHFATANGSSGNLSSEINMGSISNLAPLPNVTPHPNVAPLPNVTSLPGFPQASNAFLNMNGNNQGINDDHLKVGSGVINYEYFNVKDNMKDIKKINDVTKSSLINEVPQNLSNLSLFSSNLNLMNKNMGIFNGPGANGVGDDLSGGVTIDGGGTMISGSAMTSGGTITGGNGLGNLSYIGNRSGVGNLGYANSMVCPKNYTGLNVLKGEKEGKGGDAGIDLSNDIVVNKNVITENIIRNSNMNNNNISTDNYANILKQLCTPIKSKSGNNNMENLNDKLILDDFCNDNKFGGVGKENNNFSANHGGTVTDMFSNSEEEVGTAVGGGASGGGTSGSGVTGSGGDLVCINQGEGMRPRAHREGSNTNSSSNSNGNCNGSGSGSGCGNIYELKKLNLFAESKKREKTDHQESRINKIKKCKTKVFFYINPKYIIEPLKRKIYQNMSVFIENLISDIKAIENKNRAEILTNLHNTPWFCMIFDFDGISKLLNVFNKYLIYSDSLIIPDVLVCNKLEAESAGGVGSGRGDDPGGGRGDDLYAQRFSYYFEKSDKVEMLNKKILDYENNIIENAEKLSYLKELCNSMNEQVNIKKKKLLLLIEKAKLKNFIYKSKDLQTILDIEKRCSVQQDESHLSNDYFKIFKKINDGLNYLKKYSNIIISNQLMHNEIINEEENRQIYEPSISTEDMNGENKWNYDDEGDDADADADADDNITDLHMSQNCKKSKRKNLNTNEEQLLKNNSFSEQVDEHNDKDINKKRKTVNIIKNLQWEKEDNEEWVDEFLEDF
ncbi:conserved Plasmodium protein, unknown function [Plasmodium ovale wallikeri]|uniref:Asparagine-rich protein n=2 Tax=Plasmodium ovale TaxID=36330 RepID=A0A1C3KN57_PLAOA|nr:conserved Plasmodium protein, unknown function [Plasmodium ovale wallikeri]SBT75478.1 conserved Plasmodium protein, unknown function [Plasmodium ovale]